MSKKTLIIILLAFTVLFFGAVGGAVLLFWDKIPFLKSQETASEEADAPGEDGGGEAPKNGDKTAIGPMFVLDPFVVNLADPKASRYVRVTMQLEVDMTAANGKGKPNEGAVQEELQKRLPQIRDFVVTLLPSKQSEELRTVEGKQALRDELMGKINGILQHGKVKNIYFTDFVIQ